MVIDFILFILLGMFAGTMAGMLGIGGGCIAVPGLTLIFTLLQLPDSITVQMAVGTSLTIVFFTSISTAYIHARNHNIMWPAFWAMMPWIIPGIVIGAILARILHSDYLGMIFGVFLLGIAAKMGLGSSMTIRRSSFVAKEARLPKNWITRSISFLIGLSAGLLGVGGGVVAVPMFSHYGASMKRAAATSITLTVPVSLIGSLLLIGLGWGHYRIHWATGYVYWPAVLCVAPASIFFAKFGENWGTVVPERWLRRLFTVLLLVLAIKMLILSFI